MPSSIVNREQIDQQLDGLRDRYGPFSLEEETVTNDPEFFEHSRRLAEEGWLGDAGAWVEDEDGRVLLVGTPERPNSGERPVVATNPASRSRRRLAGRCARRLASSARSRASTGVGGGRSSTTRSRTDASRC